jgi:hypothetical protein
MMPRPKTKSFHDLVQQNVKRDATFAQALLREGIDAMLSGDLDTGRAVVRDYFEATSTRHEADRSSVGRTKPTQKPQ